MPTKTCAVCQRQQTIVTSDIKYLDPSGDFVCRKSCILRWLKSREVPARTPLWFERTVELERPAHPNFKSDYEHHFADWLTRKQIKWVHEGIAFPLGDNKTYTPDFFLPEYFAFLETKGQWSVGQKNKLRLFRQLYPAADLLVVPWVVQGQFYSEAEDWLR